MQSKITFIFKSLNIFSSSFLHLIENQKLLEISGQVYFCWCTVSLIHKQFFFKCIIKCIKSYVYIYELWRLSTRDTCAPNLLYGLYRNTFYRKHANKIFGYVFNVSINRCNALFSRCICLFVSDVGYIF